MMSILVYRTLCLAPVLLSQDAAPPTPSIGDKFPSQPEIVFAPLSRPTDGGSEMETHRIAELTALADESEDDRVRGELRLAAADLALGEQLEPVTTRALLGLDIDGQRQQSLDVAAAAKRWIEEAGLAFDGVEPAESDDEGWRPEAQERVRRLRAFGDALVAYLTPAGSDSAYLQLRTAASGLSVMREETDQRIAGAASLWQAALLLDAGLADRALSLLDPALAAPPTQSVRSAFFARILRCRAIAGQGRYTTALALLFQLEERCEDWFPVAADRGDALRAVTIVEWHVLRAWHDVLTGESHEAQRRWCIEKAEVLLDERFTPEAQAVLRLERAIPVLATIPDGSVPDPRRPLPEAAEKGEPARVDG